MFAIIQGLYILREDEEEDIERKKKERLRAKRSRQAYPQRPGKTGNVPERAKRSGQKNKKREKAKRARNKEFARVTYIFVALFLGMMGYIAYFQVVKSRNILSEALITPGRTLTQTGL